MSRCHSAENEYKKSEVHSFEGREQVTEDYLLSNFGKIGKG
jgi:hypothetical protein